MAKKTGGEAFTNQRFDGPIRDVARRVARQSRVTKRVLYAKRTTARFAQLITTNAIYWVKIMK